ncbi:neck protein [Bacillus phage vB_BanS-Thrax3]|nr:neck protein [Bacillus phage vB_BanS-Thrax3]
MAKQIQSKGLYFESEAEAIKVLTAEGRKLKAIALKVWRRYLGSYQPKQYVRTRKSQSGIRLKPVRKVGANTYSIELTFENDLMYHDSVLGKGQPKGHAIMLISSGWHSRKLENRIGVVPNFTYKGGFDYLGQVQSAYNAVRNKKVLLEIQWSGQALK